MNAAESMRTAASCGELCIDGMDDSMVEVVNIRVILVTRECAVAALLLALAFMSSLTSAQKPAPEKLQHAIDRSQDAARILSLLADPNSGFPKGLIDKARIVAIFPRADRQDAMVRRLLQ